MDMTRDAFGFRPGFQFRSFRTIARNKKGNILADLQDDCGNFQKEIKSLLGHEASYSGNNEAIFGKAKLFSEVSAVSGEWACGNAVYVYAIGNCVNFLERHAFFYRIKFG